MEKNEDADTILNGHRGGSAHSGPLLPCLLKRITEVWKIRCRITGLILRHFKNGWQRIGWAWSLEFGPFGRLEPSPFLKFIRDYSAPTQVRPQGPGGDWDPSWP